MAIAQSALPATLERANDGGKTGELLLNIKHLQVVV